MTVWGATQKDWDYLNYIIGIGEDLLPVVSNPSAKISPESKMKGLGKTPSVYNSRGYVAGFIGWTSYSATDEDIEKWAAQRDYGICIQTRYVRALDIDVPDAVQSEAITTFIRNHLAKDLPYRFRNNSAKCLMAFRLEGDFRKRTVKTSHGVIEFLAGGNQFIAEGSHFGNDGTPSGARYEWAYREKGFPLITADEFEALWAALVAEFGVEAPTEAKGARRREADLDKEDPVLAYLEENGWVKSFGMGMAHIRCPFEDEHTTEGNESSTSYLPAGTSGYEEGHFACLHAHCAHRQDGDFLREIGYVASMFEHLPAVQDSPNGIVHKDPPPFKRNKAGAILADVDNLHMALSDPDVCGFTIRRDNFRDDIIVSKGDKHCVLEDTDYFMLRLLLERGGFKPIGREMIRDTVHYVAKQNCFDSALNWINGLEWDGVPRVETFLPTFFGTEDTPYTRSVGVYMWTAMAGRIASPGCKADMVPILEGAQGVGKSRAVAALVPFQEAFTEISFGENEDNISRKMRGCMVAEIGELRGLHTKELESIKAFITRTHERWVPKFMERAVEMPRRVVFVGTTNKKEIFSDETGNRRWLPVHVERADVEGITAARSQLWAEGLAMFRKHGVMFGEAEALGKQVHGEYMIRDVWGEVIERWLETPDTLSNDRPMDRDGFTTPEIFADALRLDAKAVKASDEWRLGRVLRSLGYERKRVRKSGALVWVWVKVKEKENEDV